MAVAVSPLRLILDAQNRSAVVNLINTADVPRRFRITWSVLQQTESGGYDVVSDPNALAEHPLVKRLRYSPRQVELGPNKFQAVRMLLRSPRALPQGEYRLHLNFTPLEPLPDPQADTEPSEALKEDKIGIRVRLIVGLSIPVIVRIGKVSATARISDLRLEQEDESSFLNFTIHREGNSSLLGNAKVYVETPQGPKEVGVLNSVNVYTELKRRFVRILLDLPAKGDYYQKSIRVVYSDSIQETLLAEAQLSASP